MNSNVFLVIFEKMLKKSNSSCSNNSTTLNHLQYIFAYLKTLMYLKKLKSYLNIINKKTILAYLSQFIITSYKPKTYILNLKKQNHIDNLNLVLF